MSVQHVHKLLGYGIIDFKSDKDQLIDERLNPEGYVFCKEQEDLYHLRHFYSILAKNHNKWKIELFAMRMHQPYIYDCVHVISQEGIIVIVPPDKSYLWHRKDDIIDAVIETEFFNKSVNCASLSINIPPFTGFINTHTGKLLDSEEVTIFREKYARLQDDTTIKARKQLMTSVEESAKRLGFRNIEDVNFAIAPAVPEIVIEMVKWLKLFNNLETIFQMRPMTLAYWE